MDFNITPSSVWEKLKNTTEPIILYGTGNGADKLLDVFEEKSIEINGVTASSDFVRDRYFRGYKVLPLSHFESIYEAFTVVIGFGSSRPEVIEKIISVSRRHTVLVPTVPVIGTEIVDDDFLKKYESDISKAYNLLADEESKTVYSAYINFLYGGELDALQSVYSDRETPYEKIIKLGQNEVFIDIGAYRGDTVDSFLQLTEGEYNEIICAEPDTKTYKKLTEHCADLKNFKAVNAAVTDKDGEIGFSDAHGRQSKIGGSNKIKSITLPSLCGGAVPTYVKIDAEGCENEIISASGNILKEHKPKMNVAAYHKFTDVFSLPILIKSLNPDYEIHLRQHPHIPAWDLLFYCV